MVTGFAVAAMTTGDSNVVAKMTEDSGLVTMMAEDSGVAVMTAEDSSMAETVKMLRFSSTILTLKAEPPSCNARSMYYSNIQSGCHSGIHELSGLDNQTQEGSTEKIRLLFNIKVHTKQKAQHRDCDNCFSLKFSMDLPCGPEP